MGKLSIIGKFFGAIGVIGVIGAIGAIGLISAINLVGIHELNNKVKKLNDNITILNNNSNLMIIYITSVMYINSFIHNLCNQTTNYDEKFRSNLLHNINNLQNISMVSVNINYNYKQIIVNYKIFGKKFTYYYYYNKNNFSSDTTITYLSQ